MEIISNGAVVLGALALLVERLTEQILAVLEQFLNDRIKQAVALALTLGLGLLASFIFDFQLISQLLPGLSLSGTEDKFLTGLALAGGAAPAHELMRYVAEKKNKAKKEAASDADATPEQPGTS